MNLNNKLILEELEDNTILDDVNTAVASDNTDTPQLNDSEINNFNLGFVSDILNKFLDLFNNIKSYDDNPAVKADIRSILDSVSDDVAVNIGKLQEAIKLCTEDNSGDLIAQGQTEAQNVSKEE